MGTTTAETMGCGASADAEHVQTLENMDPALRLGAQSKSNISKVFAQSDVDGNRLLSYTEFLKTVDLIDGRMAQRFFELADSNNSGDLDFEEFATTLASANNLNDQQRLEWTYKMFDRDQSGTLEVSEVFKALNDPNVNMTYPKQRLKRMFTKMCANPDYVTMEEFCTIARVQPLLEMPFRMIHAKIIAFVLEFDPDTVNSQAATNHREWQINCAEGGNLLPSGRKATTFVMARGDSSVKAKRLADKDERAVELKQAQEARRLSIGQRVDEDEAARIAAISVAETRYTTFRLVCHGETDWQVDKKVEGKTDNPLNDNGRSQAKSIAAILANYPADVIATCELARCTDTAREIHAKRSNQDNLEFVKLPGLIGVDRGHFTGMHKECPEYLKLKQALEEKKLSFADKKVSQALCYPGGETNENVIHRAFGALVSVADLGTDVIAVCSRGVMKDIAWETSGLSYTGFMDDLKEQTGSTKLKSCCVLTVEYEAVAKTWKLITYPENLLTTHS